MGLVAKYMKTNPLNGVENHQYQSKKKEVDNRKGICQKFLHVTKIKNRSFWSGFILSFLFTI